MTARTDNPGTESEPNRLARPLDGYRVLVTGATAGIGEAIATAYAAAGAHVLVHGRDPDRGVDVATRIGADLVLTDLADSQAPSHLAAAVHELGGLDVLVNNAGFEEEAGLEDLCPPLLEKLFRVNVLAPIELTRLLLPELIASTRGSIINVTSIHESVPVARNGGYAASKAALAAYTRTAAVELGPRGVRINNLAPGAILTDMNRDTIALVGDTRFRRWIPLGRVGDVREIAEAAIFLASESSSYVTGTTLTVDGGYSNNLVRYAPDPST